MALHLEKTDKQVMAGGLLAVILLAVLSHVMQWPRVVELIFDGFSAIFGIAAGYFVYKGSDALGGNFGRYLTVIGIGVAYYTVTAIPHIVGHIVGFQGIGPISGLAIFMAQHILVFWMFVMIAYGFYLFYRGGEA
ncbi:MAG: hypothetical protein ABEK01_01620 [Candidatus Nanohaloarchaea archaeon]